MRAGCSRCRAWGQASLGHTEWVWTRAETASVRTAQAVHHELHIDGIHLQVQAYEDNPVSGVWNCAVPLVIWVDGEWFTCWVSHNLKKWQQLAIGSRQRLCIDKLCSYAEFAMSSDGIRVDDMSRL